MRGILKMALLLWAGVEFLVFIVLVSVLGLGLTLLLGLATTFIGFFLLGRSSRSVLQELQQAGLAEGQRIDFVILGPVRILAALLLIIPGFVTDLIGLLLLLPGVGDHAGSAVRRRYASRSSGTLDLDASEWHADGPQMPNLPRGREDQT